LLKFSTIRDIAAVPTYRRVETLERSLGMVLAWFDPLSAGWQAAFYVAAVVCFALGALTPRAVSARTGGLSFIALGLALAFFPLAWNSLAGT
jgi:hypothetical protein